MKTRYKKSIALLSLAALICSPVWGAEIKIGDPGRGISYGNLLIHPHLWLSGSYESNIYWASSDEESDYLGVISPGLTIKFPWDRERNLIQVLYRADIVYYRDHPQENHRNHLLDALVRYRVNDYVLEFGDRFYKTSSRFDTEFRERIPRSDNTVWATVAANFHKFSAEVGYRNFYRKFHTSLYDGYDRQENTGDLSLLYRVAPKTQALLEYVYTDIDYLSEDSRDGHYHEILGGLRGDITSRLTGTAKVGYQQRVYEDSYWNDFDGLVGYVSLEQYFSRNTDLRLRWLYSPRESTYGNNSYYRINRIWSRFSHQLARKIRGFVEAEYAHYYYPNPDGLPGGRKRLDDTYVAAVGATYSLQEWLEFTLRYSWRQRHSTIVDLSYTDQVLGVTAHAFY